jgi:hypothetical protein
MIVRASASFHGTASFAVRSEQIQRAHAAIRTAVALNAKPTRLLCRARAPFATHPTMGARALINGNTPVPAERQMSRPFVDRTMSRPFVDRTMVRPASE